MGSKNLKAVVVHGTRTVPVADSDGLREHVRNLVDEGRKNPGLQQTAKYGTSGGIPTLQKMGILPTKNFQMGEFVGADHITGQRLAETILSNVLHCDGCNVPHYREVTVKDSPYGCVEPQYSGAEYETVASLGSLCLIDDLVAINRANQLCNMYGVDTISAGVVMAWVMECFEKELLSLKDLDGLTMQWGNAAAMVKLLEKTCRREGIGDVLAEGVKRAAEKIGKGSEAFAIHVRGQEIAMHESRGKKGLALLYTAAGPRGGVHTEGAHDPVFEAPNLMPELDVVKPVSRFAMEGKGDLIHKGAALRTLINDLGICLIIYEPVFGRGTLTKLADIVNSITGWGIDVPGLMELGERANVMARCFNVREGVRRKDDYLPARFAEALPSGGSAGQRITRKDMDYMLDDYYAAAGWSSEGVPSRETLERLGISWVAEKVGV
jgi:aldehyde:ferredoxin oxidoreductase